MNSSYTILIVEDEDAIRLTLRDYLKKKGYEVLVASDGVGAIKLMLDNEVDLIVSDYRMNVLGGGLLDQVPAPLLPGEKDFYNFRLSPSRFFHSL